MSDEREKRSLFSFVVELLVIFIVAYVIAYVSQNFLFGNFQIQQRSMEPTLYENERVLINRVVYYYSTPKRGDIVILEDPLGSRSDFVKRIVAVSGDTVEIRNGQTYINSKLLSEPYVVNDMDNDNLGPLTIPLDRFFVMGDNRPKSSDSRRFGPVLRRNLLGKVFIVWWPPNQIHVPNR